MAGYIQENILDDILNKTDIVELISGYFPLKRAGRNFKALCPFHNEKTPSFMVNPQKQIFHCFGCFPAGSLIKTQNGFHSIEDVQTGQLVLTHRGRYMPVTRTLWRPYEGKLMQIYTRKSNFPVTITADHETFVIKTKNCKYKSKKNRICRWRCRLSCPEKFFNKYKIEKLSAKQLDVNDYLLYPINHKISDRKFINLNKYYNRRVSNFGRDIKSFPTEVETDEGFLRLIGYWIAEGSSHRTYIRFSLGNHEKEFAKEIKNLIENIFHLEVSIHMRGQSGKTGLELTACNSKLANIFENLCGKDAENKHIPFELQDLPPEKQAVILEAIFKGDGYTTKKLHKCKRDRKYKSITTVSLVLSEQIKDILLRLGISPITWLQPAKVDRERVRHKTAYSILWQKAPILHFSDIIQINNVFYQISPIKKIIKKDFVGDVYNLTVAEDHSYTTPNFVVGNCGKGGNAFSFLMEYERMEFPEAVSTLARKAGIELPQDSSSEKSTGLVSNLYKINGLARNFYRNILNSSAGAGAMEYLNRRGINKETVRLFMLGLSPDKWDSLFNSLRGKNISLTLLEKSGLFCSREGGGYYDRFRKRLIFPILDIKDRVVAFGARVLTEEEEAKYINSPESPIYVKGRHLYGLNLTRDEIRQKDRAVVVEGYFDCITAFQGGIKNVVASLGTSLTSEQIRLLKRYTHNVVMVYDSDRAGQDATMRSLDLFIQESMSVRVAALPPDCDPDSFLRKFGDEPFRDLLGSAKELFDYKLEILASRFDATKPEGKTRIVQEMLVSLSNFKDAVLQSEYARRLAQRLDVSEEALVIELRKIKDRNAYKAPEFIRETSLKVNPTERLLINLILRETELVSRLREKLCPADFQDARIARVFALICDLSSQGKVVRPSSLIGYLNDRELTNLISELTAEEELPLESAEEVFNDCITRIKKQRLNSRCQALQKQIKAAQQHGDHQQVNRLIAELRDLLRSQA